MSKFDYSAPATVHLGDEPNVRGSQQLVLTNFRTAADAIQFVIERLPGDLNGTRITCLGQHLSGDQIQRAYDNSAFPLPKGTSYRT